MNPRPTKAKPGDKSLPIRMRFLKQGVMIFELTKTQRAKLVLGCNVKVTVNLGMQHNPGVVDVEAQIDVTEQIGFKPGDQLKPLSVAPQIVNVPAPVAPQPREVAVKSPGVNLPAIPTAKQG